MTESRGQECPPHGKKGSRSGERSYDNEWILVEASPDPEKTFSPVQSRVAVLVIPANEELVIAQDTERIIKNLKS